MGTRQELSMPLEEEWHDPPRHIDERVLVHGSSSFKRGTRPLLGSRPGGDEVLRDVHFATENFRLLLFEILHQIYKKIGFRLWVISFFQTLQLEFQ